MGSGASQSVSSPVNTPWTPSRSRAAEASIDVMRACASGERTIAAYSAPCTAMSSV
jgi:hypothetical protein